MAGSTGLEPATSGLTVPIILNGLLMHQPAAAVAVSGGQLQPVARRQ